MERERALQHEMHPLHLDLGIEILITFYKIVIGLLGQMECIVVNVS